METVTTDLAKFGWRELKMAAQLLNAMVEQGLPIDFADGVSVAMNTNSGYVFLTNSEYDVAMMNGDKLEEWHHCPECGHEGFKEDMAHAGSAECYRYQREIGLCDDEEAEAAD